MLEKDRNQMNEQVENRMKEGRKNEGMKTPIYGTG